MKLPLGRLWLQIFVVAVMITAGVVHYQLEASQQAVGGELGLRRLDLLYLREPAPALAALGVPSGIRAVVVFCQSCKLPLVPEAQVIRSSDFRIAKDYALITNNGQLGPGYVIIDSHGQLRYRSYDADPDRHQGEIGRLVRGVQ